MESISSPPAAKRGTIYTSPAANAAIAGAFVAAFLAFAIWTGSWYATWKALHVLMAIIWVGGALMIQLFAFRILKESDEQRIAAFTKDVEYIGMRTFIPASLVVWAASFVSGAAFLGPESGRIGRLIEERGGIDAEVRMRIERILLHSRVELMLIAVIAMDMVLKPGA